VVVELVISSVVSPVQTFCLVIMVSVIASCCRRYDSGEGEGEREGASSSVC